MKSKLKILAIALAIVTFASICATAGQTVRSNPDIKISPVSTTGPAHPADTIPGVDK